MPTNYKQRKKPFENIGGKGEMLVTSISPFPTLFTIISRTNFVIWIIFVLFSAYVLNLDQSNISLSGKGLILLNFVSYFVFYPHSGWRFKYQQIGVPVS